MSDLNLKAALESVCNLAADLKQERDEARGRIAGISGQLLCSASHVGKLEKENAKLRDIAERAIVVASMVSELYQQGYRPESLDQLCAELDQLAEGGK